MTPFLLFTLYAPLSSWGDIAVGEHRNSWDRPSRSAVLGLVAAALGLTRADQGGHDALDDGYGFAVRADVPGSVIFDFHTVQTVSETALKGAFGRRMPATRRELLSVANRETIVSRRAMRQDALATAALWVRHGAPCWSLEDLCEALAHPTFVLYAGRKAQPLGAPLAPSIIEAPTLAAAFAKRTPAPPALDADRMRGRAESWGREVSHDELPPQIGSGLAAVRQELRRDARPHRARWHFDERVVNVGLLPREES